MGGSQYKEYFTCTGKGEKLFLPISELEIPYMVILLVDWRCYLLEIKRQNDTVELNPLYSALLSLSILNKLGVACLYDNV